MLTSYPLLIAMTEAGLNTVNLSQLALAQQIILFLLIIIGSSIFVSVSTVWTRKRVFENRFRGVVKGSKSGRFRGGILGRGGEGGGNGIGEVSVGERLEEQRKQGDGGDERVFESRHSGPRDPTSLLPRSGPDLGSGSVARGELLDSKLDLGSGDEGGMCEEKVKGKSTRPAINMHALPLEGLHSSTRTESRGAGAIGDADHISAMRPASSARRETDGDFDPGADTSAAGPPHRILNFASSDVHPSTLLRRLKRKTTASDSRGDRESDLNLDLKRQNTELDQATYPHYLTRHTTGRNAQFYGLSREEREHLGGVEYRAITLLGWVVPLYFVLWQLLGCIGLGAYMKMNKEEVIRANGINPW